MILDFFPSGFHFIPIISFPSVLPIAIIGSKMITAKLINEITVVFSSLTSSPEK